VSILKLSSALDKVADALESKGYLKEAAEIDAISNAIDSSGAPKDETQSRIDNLRQPQTIIQSLKNIARKVPAAIIDELLDAFERDAKAQGMREAAKTLKKAGYIDQQAVVFDLDEYHKMSEEDKKWVQDLGKDHRYSRTLESDSKNVYIYVNSKDDASYVLGDLKKIGIKSARIP